MNVFLAGGSGAIGVPLIRSMCRREPEQICSVCGREPDLIRAALRSGDRPPARGAPRESR